MIQALPTAAELGIDLARFCKPEDETEDEIQIGRCSGARVMRQLDRVLRLADLLSVRRLWYSVETLRRELADKHEVDACSRTIDRDLHFLERISCVESAKREDAIERARMWRWVQPFAFLGRRLKDQATVHDCEETAPRPRMSAAVSLRTVVTAVVAKRSAATPPTQSLPSLKASNPATDRPCNSESCNVRKPYFWTRRKGWYVKSDDGKRQIFLSTDQDEANAIWEEAKQLGKEPEAGERRRRSTFVRIVRDSDKKEVFVNLDHVAVIEVDRASRYRLLVAGEHIEFKAGPDSRVAKALDLMCQNAIRD